MNKNDTAPELINELLEMIYDKIDNSSFTVDQIIPDLRQALQDDMNENIFD